ERHKIQAGGSLGVEIDNLALHVLQFRDLGHHHGLRGARARKGRGGRRLRNWIEPEVSLNPFAIDLHGLLHCSTSPVKPLARKRAGYNRGLNRKGGTTKCGCAVAGTSRAVASAYG